MSLANKNTSCILMPQRHSSGTPMNLTGTSVSELQEAFEIAPKSLHSLAFFRTRKRRAGSDCAAIQARWCFPPAFLDSL